MLSIPHMIVVFIVVLVVFGPQKLPELARGLGKLMAEFRKASTDFKTAFEEEMRDLERQAMLVERKKAAETAAAGAPAAPAQPAALPATTGEETPAKGTSPGVPATEAPVLAPVEQSVARGTADPTETKAEPAATNFEESTEDAPHSA